MTLGGLLATGFAAMSPGPYLMRERAQAAGRLRTGRAEILAGGLLCLGGRHAGAVRASGRLDSREVGQGAMFVWRSCSTFRVAAANAQGGL